MLNTLQSDIILGYLDDVSGGGDLESVADDVTKDELLGAELGLRLNRNKCKLISSHFPVDLPHSLRGFKLVDPSDAILLGALILDGPAMDRVLLEKCLDLQRASDQMALISSHDALVILNYSLGSTRMLYVLRASPCTSNPALIQFDDLQRTAIGKIANCTLLNDINWIQASLPVKHGGLGIRSVDVLAPSAFLASAAATLSIQSAALPASFTAIDRHVDMVSAVQVGFYLFYFGLIFFFICMYTCYLPFLGLACLFYVSGFTWSSIYLVFNLPGLDIAYVC